MPGFDTGSVMYALNVDFTGNSLTSGTPQVTQNGQLLIGSAVAPNIRVGTLGSTDSSITWTFGNGTITGQVTGGSTVGKTITGNDANPLQPSLGNWNIFGSGSLTSTGSLSTLTMSLTGLTNHAVLVGAGTSTITKIAATANTGAVLQNNSGADPSYSTATYPSTTTINQILYSSAANTVSGLTTANQAVLTTGATGTPVLTALATNGQLIIGSTAGVPAAATLTAGTGISITNGSNSITIAVSGSTVLETLTGNSGGAISPSAGNINTLGTGSITIAGAGSTLTTQLTGLTNHAVLVGAGTATITNVGPTATAGQVLQSNGASADPSFSTATYPSTTTINQILYSSSANVVGGITAANSASLVSTSAGVPQWSSSMTNGQLIIGSTGATPTAATLTAGAGISITNAAGSITVATSTGGFTWSETSGAFNAVKQNGYFITTTATATLPASPTEGDTIRFMVDTTNLLTITGNTGQKIRLGTTISAAAGTCVNTQRGDAIELVYMSTGTTWQSVSAIGGWNLT